MGERLGGRQAGTPNRVNLAARLRIEGDADPIGKLIEAAKTGKVRIGEAEHALDIDQYLGVIRDLRRMACPDARSSPIRVTLPEIKTAEDVLAATAAVVAAMSRGEITPEEAVQASSVVDRHRQAIETLDHERRLTELERMAAK